VIHGSVTSIGVAYPATLETSDLARHVAALLGPILEPRTPGRWPMRFTGCGSEAPWIEVEIKQGTDDEATTRMLERFVSSPYGELEAIVQLAGVGRVEAVLRPQVGLNALLLDVPDAALFPEWSLPDPEPVTAAVRELLLRWFDISRFAIAFAGPEAELEIDPRRIEPGAVPFALLARPADGAGGAPLDFSRGAWPISPLGA